MHLSYQVATCCVLFGVAIALSVSPLCSKGQCDCVLKNNQFAMDCSRANLNVTTEVFVPSNFGANGTLYPVDYFNLTGIRFLHFHRIMPNSSMKVLDLARADITTIIDNAFQNLQELRELILSHNRIEALTPDTLKGLRVDGQDYPLGKLRTLRLDHNRLHTLHQDSFQHVEATVESLYLNSNPLIVIDVPTMQAILGVRHLKLLDLSDTQIQTLPAHFLHTPAELQELRLEYNNILNVRSLGLEFAHVLSALSLNGNPLENITEETGFPPTPSLKVLHLSNMPNLKVLGNHSMSLLTGLEELHVSHNPELRTIAYSALMRIEAGTEVPVIQKLRKLYAGHNMLTHLSLQLDWSTLTDLDINGNPWTCECENQWMVDVLMPIYKDINAGLYAQLQCGAPSQMEGYTFRQLSEQKYEMRCLDYYGHQPENDGVLLVSFLIGLLLGIAFILLATFAYKRHWFGLFDNSPASFSRQFYGRTPATEDELYA